MSPRTVESRPDTAYRALVAPFVAYLDVLQATQPQGNEAPMTFVFVPEYVPRSWWERALYNQAGGRLRRVLVGRPHTVVIGVPYRRDDRPHESDAMAQPAGSLIPRNGGQADDRRRVS